MEIPQRFQFSLGRGSCMFEMLSSYKFAVSSKLWLLIDAPLLNLSIGAYSKQVQDWTVLNWLVMSAWHLLISMTKATICL